MSRALVLGGGGPVGIGWEAGLLSGLVDAGIDIGAADLVVGTSAGSVVGATLAAGGDLREATSLAASAPGASEPGPGDAAATAAAGDAGLEALMATLAAAAADPGAADSLRAQLGRIALDARTIDEPAWLAAFATFADQTWPTSFACTAVDTATGAFRVFDAASGVPLQLAIASSCAVPGIFPPTTVGAARYMDGGVRDMLNADVAAGHDTVLAVSCTLLELPEGLAPPEMQAVLAATRAQFDTVRASGKLEVVVPGAEMLEISGYGMHLMDFSRAAAAYEAGRRQAVEEAGRIGGAWG